MMKGILLIFVLTLPSGSKNFKQFSHTIATTAQPAIIWDIWTDVATWPTWDTGLQSAELKGPFQLNAKGKLKPDKGPKVRFKVITYEPGKQYTIQMPLPLGKLLVKRYLEVKDGQTYFTHEVQFKGLLGGFFAKRMGKRYAALLPNVMLQIQKIAEKS